MRSSFSDPKHPSVANTLSNFTIGLGGPEDFHADFTGVLRRRDVSTLVGFDSPSIDEMPYVLEIKQVDNIRFERATFWMPLPPVK